MQHFKIDRSPSLLNKSCLTPAGSSPRSTPRSALKLTTQLLFSTSLLLGHTSIVRFLPLRSLLAFLMSSDWSPAELWELQASSSPLCQRALLFHPLLPETPLFESPLGKKISHASLWLEIAWPGCSLFNIYFSLLWWDPSMSSSLLFLSFNPAKTISKSCANLEPTHLFV